MTRFNDFWALCPRKRGKGAARAEYAKACQKVDEETILEGARRWRKESIGVDPKFICHPRTWLHQERWDDEPDTVVKPDQDAELQARAWRVRRNEYIPAPDERALMERKGFL